MSQTFAPTLGDRLASCDGKTPYLTYAAAWKVAKRMGPVNIYRCRHCRHWHVGNSVSGRFHDV